MEIKNAVIESAIIDKGERGFLTISICLDYGNSGHQCFAGWLLYSPDRAKIRGDYTGHFIFRSMQIAGVERWDHMAGKCIRTKGDRNKIIAIGHILKDDWFNPSEDFDKMQNEI